MSAPEHVTSTIKHKQQVGVLLTLIVAELVAELMGRALAHDNSKFSEEEYDLYTQVTPRLKELTYGSDEYRGTLREMKPALTHHYLVNDHHPEWFEKGIEEMNLIQLLEMVCDWVAASQRTKDGNMFDSLETNKNRFGIDSQLYQIIKNTVMYLTTHSLS